MINRVCARFTGFCFFFSPTPIRLHSTEPNVVTRARIRLRRRRKLPTAASQPILSYDGLDPFARLDRVKRLKDRIELVYTALRESIT